MRVLVTGATGFIGSHVAAGLLAAGHEVTACVRDPARAVLPAAVRRVRCDFAADTDPQAWLPRLAEIDAVVNAAGIIAERPGASFAAVHRDAPIALFTACRRAGVRRVVQISALGADEGAFTAFHLTKRAADDALARLDLDWVVLRPSLVYGEGGKSFALFQALAALPLLLLPEGGRQPVQPVHVDDLIRAVIASLSSRATRHRRIDVVCGASAALSLAGYLTLLRARLGYRAPRVLNLPYPIARLLARAFGRFGGGMVSADTLAMLSAARPVPGDGFREAFGFLPANPAERLAPAGAGERLRATLYFVGPLLRFTLGLMWVWTGLTSALFYPHEESYALLARCGIEGPLAPAALYGAALLDLGLGLATWARRRVALVGMAQLAVMLGYSLILSLFIPELWLHPFGPVAKNLPLAAATLAMIALEEPRP